jgi:hypothetical protein
MNWVKFLEDKDKELKDKGYRKYFQDHKRSDFQYFKTIDKKYQIGIFFYDFRRFDVFQDIISISYECFLFPEDDRIDLSVSKDITIEEFEKMAESFYLSMKEFI